MDSAKLNDWLQVIGIFAVVASLVFVGIQLVQSQNLANADRFQEMISARATINDEIAESASIILKANDGAELTAEEHLKLSRVLDSLWAQGFFGQQAAELVGGPAQGPAAGLAMFLFENPGVRRIWTDIQINRESGWDVLYRPNTPLHGFNQKVREHLEQLEGRAE